MDTFLFDHVRLRPDQQIALHTQESWELSYIVSGSGEREIGTVRQTFTAGDLVLIPPGIPHRWTFDTQDTDRHGRIENITITFEETLLKHLAEALPPLLPVIDQLHTYADAVSFPPRQQQQIATLLHRMCHETDAARAATLVSLLCHLVEGSTFGHYERLAPVRQRLAQVRIYVSCNYRRPISIDEIAQHVGMNRSAFCTFFRKHTGQTFVEYTNAYRIHLAFQYLKTGQMSVTEACYASGFNDVAYFCRAFRRYKGFPPSQAKRQP